MARNGMQVREVTERAGVAPAEGMSPPSLPVRAFLSGRSEDLVVDLLAYGLYSRDREARGPLGGTGGVAAGAPAGSDEDPVIRFRREATADLTNFTFRFFHNQVEEIRLAAVREHLGALPRPPGFLRLVTAAALALVLVGTAALWAAGHGGLLAEMAARAVSAIRAIGV
jgi:AcrR family transcriptional regulator